jgi:hypothetical protein
MMIISAVSLSFVSFIFTYIELAAGILYSAALSVKEQNLNHFDRL